MILSHIGELELTLDDIKKDEKNTEGCLYFM